MNNQIKESLVSIITAAHNAEKYIALTIESVLAQTYRNWEFIVVDDASTDCTRDIIAEYTKKDARIKFIHLDTPVLQTMARIKAINASCGEYLAILDADDICFPNRLSVQVDFLKNNPDIAVVGSDAELIDSAGNVIGRKKKDYNHAEIAFKLLLQTQFTHSSVCMRKKAYDEVGGYNGVTYRLYVEEYDLWNRFVARGFKLANVPQALIQYRIHSAGISQNIPIGIRTSLHVDVSEKYVNSYLHVPHDKVQLMIDMVNDKKLPIYKIFLALRWYKDLARAYLSHSNLNVDERNIILKIYRDRKRHVIGTAMKRLIRITE